MAKGDRINMTENLQEMIQQQREPESRFNVDSVVEAETKPTVETEEEVQNEISITTLGPWFSKYRDSITNVHAIQAQVTGVDPNQNLIVSVDDPNGEELEPGIIKRTLSLFDNAAIQPVLDMEPSQMRVYNNNTFRVVYGLSEDTVIKMYGVKTGLIAMFSFAIDGGILPYAKVVAKKRAESIEIPSGNIETYRRNLVQPVNLETLQLLYKQSSKAETTFNTNQDAINWLLSRQDNITDINHHLEIDKVIMTLLS
jgi:hypothetical protein